MTTGFVQRFKGKIVAQVAYFGAGNVHFPAVDSLTAHASGGQASATQLAYGYNRFSTVATLNDSGALPLAIAGQFCLVVNDGAAAAKIYAQNGSSDTIDGTAGSTGVPLTNAKRTLFFCLTTGAWISFGGAESA